MAATALTDRYAANLHGVLSCYERIIVTGTLPGACYAGGMTSFLYLRGIRIFDYLRFAEPLRDRIRERAQQVCEAAGVQIEHVNKSHVPKEDLVARVLAVRGEAPGLVHVISAMEACPSCRPWLDKSNGHVHLRADQGKCLHYYFYFIDEDFGLCYLRVPTWAPFGAVYKGLKCHADLRPAASSRLPNLGSMPLVRPRLAHLHRRVVGGRRVGAHRLG